VTTLPGDGEVDVLDDAECLALLRTATVGRLAYTEGALPAVQPVPFVLGNGEVFIPTHPGSRVAAASRGAVVALAVDDVDLRARTGWSVTVVGPARLIADHTEVGRLDQLGARLRAQVWAQLWAPGARHCYVGIAVRLVRGGRLTGPGTVAAVPAVPDDPARTGLPA
jgi:nitroimidazol reductase NimA-like FMN-containing flavoprotein (pyridoxamine 5'-phosphate oxidase superfamily)